jgi:hypothetical protein
LRIAYFERLLVFGLVFAIAVAVPPRPALARGAAFFPVPVDFAIRVLILLCVLRTNARFPQLTGFRRACHGISNVQLWQSSFFIEHFLIVYIHISREEPDR